MKPQLVFQQKITAFVNKYKIFSSNDQGGAEQLIGFAQQKRFNFKEKVIFYQDENKATPQFIFRAEKVFDIHGKYFVEDANGQVVGMFKKEFKKSLINSSWKLLTADEQEVFAVSESNPVLAAFRRFIGFVPFVGDLLEVVILFFRYHFKFIDIETGAEVGKFRKTTLFRDHYVLEMNDEYYQKLDSKVFAAFGVALDALQSR